MRKKLLFLFTILCIYSYTFAQNSQNIQWYNPENESESIVCGRAWDSDLDNYYSRLPLSAKKVVRTAVWDLSQDCSGMSIHFKTNADTAIVRYSVSKGMSMYHMPSTGVSGIDIYARTASDQWIWLKPNYSWGDTITVSFVLPKQPIKKYTIWLPLYNHVTYLEVGVDKEKQFSYISNKNDKKPIVVYGTSIAQGACASRPGMAWTNIVSRKLFYPVINQAFSGNGRLEKDVLDYICQIDASVYVLDCLPNLTDQKYRENDSLYNKVINAVLQIRKSHPKTPILLVDHDGYGDEVSNKERQESVSYVNFVQQQAFRELTEHQKISDLYYLSHQEIGQNMECFVDGTHSTDLGMVNYARAYCKKLKEILNITYSIQE